MEVRVLADRPGHLSPFRPPTDLTHITKRQLSLARRFEDRQRRASSDGWTPAPGAAGEFRPSRRVHETYLGVFLGGKKMFA
ncbi:hypothetical protein FOZ62_015674 [Perkinsus olseni]|uniref:Uncharacterized protein n=1 Tax=Perkinsus olseni TaxID=32597 RepID=A0A7J6T0L8_PEROL|nr:hypothetical protein FOZ62_015674 [Perkinsus olseni]